MDYLEQMTAKFKSAIAAGSTPDKSLKINLKDTGIIVVDSSSATNEDVPADTTLTISRKDFDSLVAGKLNPSVAFMQGKIKIQGDPTAALQWLPVIQRANG
jgi:putative sterol carrier protein